MKKVLFSILAVFALLFGNMNLQGMAEALSEGLNKGTSETLSEGIAEGGASAFKSGLQDSFNELSTVLTDATEGLSQEALEQATKIVSELGESLGQSITGEVGSLSFTISDEAIQKAVGELNGIDGLTIEASSVETAVKDVNLNSNITKAVEDVSAPKTELEAKAGQAATQVAALEKTLNEANNFLDSLQKSKTALEVAGKETTDIDAQIEAQTKVVESIKTDKLAGKLESLETTLKDASDEAKQALETGKQDLATKRTTLSESQAAVADANRNLELLNSQLSEAQTELEVANKKTLDSAQANVDGLTKQVDTAANDLTTKLKAAEEAQKAFDSAEADVWKKNKSSVGKSYEIAKTKYNELKNSGTATEEELLGAKDVMDKARAMVKEDGTFIEKAKLYTKDIAKEQAITAGQTLIAGVLFMVPGIIMGYLEGDASDQALLETIGRPQNFGGIDMQIPTELLNKDNPLASIFLYVGFPGDDCATGTFTDGSCRMNENNIDATRDFYVSMGSSDFEGWATQPITSTSFSGTMIHLNTGYAFNADGQPVDLIFPAKPLLSTQMQDDASLGAPVSIASFLKDFASVLNGSITVENFNAAAPWEGIKTSDSIGGQDEDVSDEDSFAAEQTEEAETTIKADNLSNIVSWYGQDGTEKSCTIGAKSITPCPDLLQESLVGTIAAPLAWGESGVNNVWPLRILSDEEVAQVTGTSQSLGASATEDDALPAYGIYLYKTTFTDLGQKLNDITQGDSASGIEGLVADYVMPLNAENEIVPIRVPMLETGGPYGPTFKYRINPEVVKLYSLLSGQATTLDGTVETIASDISGQQAYKNISASGRAVGQIGVIQTWYPSALKYGPFTIGGKKLTIDTALSDLGTYVYAIDPAQQSAGTSGTLEDGSIDYVIALDTDKNIIDLGTAGGTQKEFLSLVTSRFYDGELNPYNSANGYEDTDFVVANCSGNYGIVSGIEAPSGCEAAILAGKSGPFTAPLYTLFMDADINPYNNPSLMSFTVELGEQVGTQVSTLIESAMVSAGITELLMQKLSSDQRTALINLIIAALPTAAGDDWASFQTALTNYQDKITAWKDAGKASSGLEYDDVVAAQSVYSSAADVVVSNVQANGSALGTLGSNLKDASIDSSLVVALDDVQNQLSQAAPRAIIVPSTSQQYVDAGMIPVADQWAMNLLSSTMKAAVQDGVDASYSEWKNFLTSTVDQWALYMDKGPFNMSSGIIPVTIEATSVEDLARGVYIYTSPNLPGEFLVIGSGTSDVLLGQKFEALNKAATPYILSLSSGKMYDVSSENLEIVADYTPKTPEEITSFIISKFSNITEELKTAIIDSEATITAARAAEEFSHSFYRFALLIDNQDADVGAFVYQDITPIANAKNVDRAELLSQVKDFFVYAELQSNSSSYSWGLEMPNVLNDDSRLISLVTGMIYSKSGPVGLYELYQEPSVADNSTQSGAFNSIWSIVEDKVSLAGGSIRSELITAITAQLQVPIAQAQQALADYVKTTQEEDLVAQGYDLLTSSDVSAINAIAPSDDDPNAVFCSVTNTNNCMISAAYPNLKLYNGKYYQVYQSYLSDSAQTVADFAVSGGPDDIAIIYDVTYGTDGVTVTDVSINTVLKGEIRDQARAAAGIIISGQTQTLGIPNEQPGINASLLMPLTGFTSQSLSFGTADFYSYKQSAMVYITPTGGTPYYLDLYSGIMFDDNGKPISIGGKYAKNNDDNRYLLVSRVSDGSVTSVIYEGFDGIALEYFVKDVDNNPSQEASTGSYSVKTYTMQALWDSTNNLKIVEYSPLTTGIRYYEVTEQSAITYDENNNELLYFQNDLQIFTDVGNFREIQYATGKPANMIINPLSAYVLESTDGQDEAIFWQDTQSASTGIIDYVVYKKSGDNFVANYTWEDIFGGTTGDGTATISFTDNLVDSTASSAYGITIYYSELTDVDNATTYQFVDKLNTIDQTTMNTFLTLLGVTVARDYQGGSVLARDLSSVQTMNTSTLSGNVYPIGDVEKLGDQFTLATILKASGVTDADAKYLYKIGSSRVSNYPDKNFEFYTTIGTGNYIDIETGIAYSASTNKAIGTVKYSELLLLRDAIVHANVNLIPTCQLAESCSAGQEKPTKKVLSYMA